MLMRGSSSDLICCEATDDLAGRTVTKFMVRSWEDVFANWCSTSRVLGQFPPRRFEICDARSFSSSSGQCGALQVYICKYPIDIELHAPQLSRLSWAEILPTSI